MPFARLTLIPAPPPEMAQRLCAGLADLIARDLGKRGDLTSVLVETPGAYQWTIGANDCKSAAHLEVCVTFGTNSAEEKQTFIANAMALLRRELQGLGDATYVIIKDLPGGDWGYGGRTQADRAASMTQAPV